MKRKILISIGILASLCILGAGVYWFEGEYQYYKSMYERGKNVGVVFEDCEHTARYVLDYSISVATREPVGLSISEFHRIHPRALEYMWCCGQIQDELLVWTISAGVAVTYTIVVAAVRRKKQREC